jgi:hypothetical protein
MSHPDHPLTEFEGIISAREHFVRHGIPAELRAHYITWARMLRAEAIHTLIRRCARLLLLGRQSPARTANRRPRQRAQKLTFVASAFALLKRSRVLQEESPT